MRSIAPRLHLLQVCSHYRVGCATKSPTTLKVTIDSAQALCRRYTGPWWGRVFNFIQTAKTPKG